MTNTETISKASSLETFRGVLRAEAAAIEAGANRLGPEVDQAVELLRNNKGRVILTGLGKAGFVARKAAATFCSTGTPANFLHPTEALHGDIGIVNPDDLLIAISNSGETEEVLALLPFVARFGIPVIAITGKTSSSLARRSAVVIDAGVESEADPISVAPTSSTTLAMAICDALAVALMTNRGFTREQFAIFHPGGSLGRKLLLRVTDLMRTGDKVPVISSDQGLQEAIETISAKRMGAVFVVDSASRVVGILTDGDVRRWYQRTSASQSAPPVHPVSVSSAMTPSPKSVPASALAAEALKLMEDSQITVLAVVDPSQELVGAIHLHDLIRAGLA